MNKKKKPTDLTTLNTKDKDLIMFTSTNLNLTNEEISNVLYMELLTTNLATILLLLTTFTTIFFDKDLFGDAIAVNLTIMLVMTIIFTSKIEELPPTSYIKMIEIWLIFCLVVSCLVPPFKSLST